MRVLIDTQLLIWMAADSARLRASARQVIAEAEVRTFSVVSIWEVAIKHALGKADFPFDPARLRDGLVHSSYAELAVLGEHALEVPRLPSIHGDPFDRMLVAQARIEGLTLLTADRTLGGYGAPVQLV